LSEERDDGTTLEALRCKVADCEPAYKKVPGTSF